MSLPTSLLKSNPKDGGDTFLRNIGNRNRPRALSVMMMIMMMMMILTKISNLYLNSLQDAQWRLAWSRNGINDYGIISLRRQGLNLS
jgi:hypothetical protein